MNHGLENGELIGELSKGLTKDLPDSYLAVDDTEIGVGNRIPLWMFGLLY